MADHFMSMNRGVAGGRYSDFTTGTSSTAGNDMELRVRDGASLTKKDVQLFLEAAERFFANAQQVSTAGFDVAL